MASIEPATSKRFATTADGTRIAWQRQGAGEPAILFIPTWNLVDSRAVRHQVEFFAARTTVVTYDPRGAGASDRPERGYEFPRHAADALTVLDAAGVARASIVTASRGINSAILLATAHAGRIDRLVAVAPFLPLHPRSSGSFWAIDEITQESDLYSAHGWRTDWPAFARWFMAKVFSEPDSEQTIQEFVEMALDASPEILITQERETDWTAIPPLLGSVTMPTLIIHGDGDLTTPVSMARELAAALPDARVELVPGGGHRPDVSTPARVNALIASFLFR